MIVTLVVVVLVLWLLMYRFKRRRLYELAKLIPSPDCELPVIGVTHKFIGNTQDIMSSLKYLSYQSMKHNGVMKSWMNHCLYIMMVNPQDLEVVLKTSLEKDDLHRFMRDVTGNGLVFAPVSIWRRRRKILVPAFTPKNVEDFVQVFSEQSTILLKNFDSYFGTGSFDVWPLLTAYNLDSICETVMGVRFNAQSNPDTQLLMSITYILNAICERLFHIWLHPDWIFKLTPSYSSYIKYRNMGYSLLDKIIKRKRVQLQNNKEQLIETDKDFESTKMRSFLDLLISLSGGEKGYTDLELREEVQTLIAAAMDTTAVAISNTLKLLAQYPHVQGKVYDEILEIFGGSNTSVVKNDLVKLKYLEMVIKESLRLLPPVPFIIRKIETETKLPSGSILPAGCGVVVSIWGAHRDPQYWGQDAEHFDPERFLPERFDLLHPCSYMPFSNGPRNCVGFQYSLMSIKTVLVTILRKYQVTGEEESGPIPHIPTKFEIMMKAVDGYQIELEKRR